MNIFASETIFPYYIQPNYYNLINSFQTLDFFRIFVNSLGFTPLNLPQNALSISGIKDKILRFTGPKLARIFFCLRTCLSVDQYLVLYHCQRSQYYYNISPVTRRDDIACNINLLRQYTDSRLTVILEDNFLRNFFS